MAARARYRKLQTDLLIVDKDKQAQETAVAAVVKIQSAARRKAAIGKRQIRVKTKSVKSEAGVAASETDGRESK